MDISVFDIPLLREEIAQYLHSGDLTRCVLISKEWNAWFTPMLWRNIDFHKKIDYKVLFRRKEHVRSATSIEIFYNHSPKDFISSNLRSLKYTPYYSATLSMFTESTYDEYRVLQMSSRALLLQDLTIYSSGSDQKFLKDLTDTLSRLRQLKKLDLQFLDFIKPIKTQRIIESSRHCQSIRLNCGTGMSRLPPPRGTVVPEPEYPIEVVKDAMDRMEGIQFRDLTIGLSCEMQESAILVPLLERCHFLERLDFIRVHGSITMGHISRILRAKTSPRLRHLGAVQAPKYTHDMIDLLSAVGSRGKEGSNGENSTDGRGLQSLTYGCFLCFDQQIAEALPLYFSATLTCLDIIYSAAKLKDLTYFLGQLPKLESLAATISLNGAPEGESESEAFLQSSWACLGIRKLYLRINNSGRPYRTNVPDWKGSCKDRCMEHAFSQIGKLAQLEEWRLDSDLALLDQTNGYQGHLAGLKRLKILNLRCYSRYLWLTASDIKWMLEHWPRLGQIFLSDRFIRGWSPYSAKKRPSGVKGPLLQGLAIHSIKAASQQFLSKRILSLECVPQLKKLGLGFG
ncbi:hypothetical protein BGX26_002502, partial [Mortierella sp. AD094]